MSALDAGKRLAEAALAGVGRIGIRSHRVRGRTLILAYHNVVSDDAVADGDLPLHLPFRVFKAHLDAIESLALVVPLEQGLLPHSDRRPRVVITFDDAYRGALRLAVPELQRRGHAATMFVPPAYVPDGTFWWDDVARARQAALDPNLREQALRLWQGREAKVRTALPEAIEAGLRAPADLKCGKLEEIEGAVRGGLLALGSHTWSHPNLAMLDDAELAPELARPLGWLRDHFGGATIPYLSYPYGLDSERVRAAAAAAGYDAALRVMGGWTNPAELDRFAIPRRNVPAGLSAEGLALRLTGMIRE